MQCSTILIVGAGFAGATIAERLAAHAGKKVLICDKRPHIGGNAYDHYDEAGILVHKYGPHIFHTNSRDVYEYLSQFTEWRPYQAPRAGLRRRSAAADSHQPRHRQPDVWHELHLLPSSKSSSSRSPSRSRRCARLRTSSSARSAASCTRSSSATTRGSNGASIPSELDATVTARVPVRTNRDDRYFTDTYQVMPLHGYTRMFERMLSHPNIKILLNADYREVEGIIPHREVIFTGPVDEYLRLPVRQAAVPLARLQVRNAERRRSHRPAPVINYPNENAYTRVTEFKYLTGQEHAKTTLVYEFARADWLRGYQ